MGSDHADDHHDHPPARPLVRLRQLLRPERRDLFAVGLYAVAVAVLSLATPIAVEALVNTVAFGVFFWPVVVLAGILFGCLGLAAAVRAMQVLVVEHLQRRLFVRVVADYAGRLPRVKVAAFDRQHGPELANRFFDVLTLQKALATLMLDGLALMVTAVVGMVVLAFYHPFLLGFDVILVLLIAFALFVLGIGGIGSALHESHAKYAVAGWLEELLRELRPLKFAGGPTFARERADRLAAEYVAARRGSFRVVWRQTLFALGLQVVASTALLGLGGYLVINRQLTLGQLVAAELIVALVVASVAKLGKYAEAYYDLLASAEKLGVPTDLPVERTGGEVLPAPARGMGVRLRGVASAGGRPVATPADWQVTPGERVAILAPHGGGKTTALELLCGLRDVDGGAVELDGADVRGLDLDRLREQITLVGGTNDLFLGTVLENVRVGRPNIPAADVRAALQAVGLLDAVHALPRGLDTPLVPGGPLSAGQAARLAVARGLAGRPRLLLLDGVLDVIDLRDCPDLLSALFDRHAPWTLIVATTDPAVARLCDRTVGDPDPVPLTPAAGD